ncbi:hypothetical protein jhhlp_006618 [Lomentospora prolificans]|uniref:Uncharacterized protein n=1 Tax=Lomentospora prolificans TaxID=41688 RepID=A0A2N3N6F6_9PEZI|nr:hypothetical protein jhhlp_006618 [Lomentospora prolificans]
MAGLRYHALLQMDMDLSLKHLLATDNIDADLKAKNGRSPLSYTSELGHEAIVKHLLAPDNDVDSTANNGRTLLSYASKKGQILIVELLSSLL